MKIAKYFWDLNEQALRQTGGILINPRHPKFNQRMVALLSRCDQPKELFSFIPKDKFIKAWPGIKSYWIKISRKSEFRDWWQTIYEQILEERGIKQRAPKGESSGLFKGVGALIRKARISKGLSQKELSLLTGIKQPEISKIEEGRKNITIATLARFCQMLNIHQVTLT